MKLFSQFLVWIILLVPAALLAQTKESAQIREQLRVDKKDTTRVVLLCNLARTYQFPDSMMPILYEALNLSRKLDFVRGEIMALNCMGHTFNNKGNFPKALELYLEALKKGESDSSERRMVATYLNIGYLYSHMKNNQQSLYYTFKSNELADKFHREDMKANIYLNIGDAYEKLNMLDSARYFTNLAMDKIGQSNDSLYFLALVQGNLGNIYRKMNQPEVAMAYYRRAVKEIKLMENELPGNSLGLMCDYGYGMALIFSETGHPDSATYYAKWAISDAKSFNVLLEYIPEPARFLAAHYKSIKNYDSVFYYQSMIIEVQDSLYNHERTSQIQNLTFDESMRQQDREVQKLKVEEERWTNLQYGIIGIGLVSFAILFFFLSKSIIVNEKWVRFLGILGLLLIFEFLNLLLHPYIGRLTHHSPALMLAIMVFVAFILIPIHHRLEKWITGKLIVRNKKLRLVAARKIVEKLEKDTDVIA